MLYSNLAKALPTQRPEGEESGVSGVASASNNDVRPAQRGIQAWDRADPASAVQSVYQQIEDHANGVIDWYLNAKRSKSVLAGAYRTGALILGGLAGLLPIFAQMGVGPPEESNAWWSFLLPLVEQPAWASVFIGLAALLVLLDRFFGCSTAWMRFITTEQQVRQRCKAFMTRVDDPVRAETEKWVGEFQDAIKQVNEIAKSRAAMMETGAVNVIVANGDQAEGGRQLAVDNSPPITHGGSRQRWARWRPPCIRSRCRQR